MNSQDVILGMLMRRSMTGYEIKQLLENLFSYFYSSSYGTIYPMLNKMEKDGLLTKENVVQDGKPNKNVYTLTDQGKEQFNSYMYSPLELDSVKSDLLVRLFFGKYVGTDRVIAWLKQVQTEGLKQLQALNERYSMHKHEMHPTQVICIQLGIKSYEAKLEAIAEGLERMEQLDQEERI
ncbi:PadR family transcriptional regulator [Cohnella lupini]|uniref:PadR family transcriptional regulator n=1 Tax=Cohnella lupini TaxID=1294267 RepID=A0A3D9IWT6_9BACL|nr:helix-turn-helix transcriptional regulator [Cohnella lupini]RED66212.1 PadR family transcriptional regulator [Cohnella lupini]